MTTVTIIDYGVGNLGSICNMLKRIGVSADIARETKHVASAKKLLLPGVGAFDNAMTRLNESNLKDILAEKVLGDKIPILGICLGMQLLMEGSEEGQAKGLGWIAGRATRIPASSSFKVPHMGWDVVQSVRNSPLIAGLPKDARFYFAHSYCVRVNDPQYVILRGRHGVEFDAAVQSGNIFGAQFHPEKSHRFGMKLLSNFAGL